MVTVRVAWQVASKDVIRNLDDRDLAQVDRASLLTDLVAIECIIKDDASELLNTVSTICNRLGDVHRIV